MTNIKRDLVMSFYKLDTQPSKYIFLNKTFKKTNSSKFSEDIESSFQIQKLINKNLIKFPLFWDIRLKTNTTMKGHTPS